MLQRFAECVGDEGRLLLLLLCGLSSPTLSLGKRLDGGDDELGWLTGLGLPLLMFSVAGALSKFGFFAQLDVFGVYLLTAWARPDSRLGGFGCVLARRAVIFARRASGGDDDDLGWEGMVMMRKVKGEEGCV